MLNHADIMDRTGRHMPPPVVGNHIKKAERANYHYAEDSRRALFKRRTFRLA